MVRVLVIKPSSLGDLIHAAGAVRAIADANPHASISWLVNEEYVDLVREFPGVSEVIPFPRRRLSLRRFPRCVPDAISWFRALRRDFDVAIDLQGLQRSALFARASGARERFGPRSARELGWIHYNRRVSIPAELVHAVDRLNRIAEHVLVESRFLRSDGATPAFDPRLSVPARAAERAHDVIAEIAPGDPALVAICPGTRWESKEWPEAQWIELLRAIHAQRWSLHPVLLGAASEAPRIDAILRAAAVPAANLAGRIDLWTTAAVLERSACAVTLDSAPLHLAAAVGTPVVALFGPTDPARVGPRGVPSRVLRRDDLTCLECYERRCPLPRRVCLPDLSADRVLDALEELLGSRPSPAEQRPGRNEER